VTGGRIQGSPQGAIFPVLRVEILLNIQMHLKLADKKANIFHHLLYRLFGVHHLLSLAWILLLK